MLFAICLITRLTIGLLSKYYPKIIGYGSIFPALGFLFIYMFNLRSEGVEVCLNRGDSKCKIWWNNLRPIHGILWGLFAYMSITNTTYMNGQIEPYHIIILDTLIGLVAYSRS
jgi:hypothetical protein